MAAGSLLGVTHAHKESFPVGKVDIVELYPMDFQEFLDAIGQGSLCRLLDEHDHQMVDTFSTKYIEYLYQYYYVGGMQEVVKAFAEQNSLKDVRMLQESIIDAYRRDIARHTTKTESVRIGQVLNSLPSQLAKENKKFIYAVAKKGARAADFELAIQWLIDAGIVYKVSRVEKIAVPLKFYEDITAFKLFLLDVGLLCCMAGVDATMMLAGSNAMVEFKGVIAEEYVAQQLTAEDISLYYWSNDRTPAEFDFVIQQGVEAYPIEVKSSTNVRGRSLTQYLKDNPDGRALRFSLLPYKAQDRLTNMPLYAITQLSAYL